MENSSLNTDPGDVFVSTGNEQSFTEKVIQEKNIRISLVPSKRKKVKKVNIIIEGEFTISTAAIVKEHCYKLMQHFEVVSITLRNVTDIDLAAIQLLRVLKVSPTFSQRTITIDSELSKKDKSLLNTAGLIELVSRQ
jgi:hypothetical protein